ncbi:photosynthetic complex putative assembly protein PuhB [Rhodospirillum centenum]|uniref:Photosynthetic complex assembly protein PuhB, putative n=1 Tax=Rhodospirillum centenum (strain ATCC 51521 / SW) TaxID=414684 RepID=B6ITW1_RHOCS|nr:photosynthetic complex putative assembly protein PuhB [Rhodospirillum centenum]ACI99497.1 photosynthetic complex assembly protein PuhB, putative [Rhodospirillum centenum SW]
MMEHEDEPVRGLPAPLPSGESQLWQGGPDWRALARRAYHVQAVSLYFVLLMAWSVTSTLMDGGTVGAAARGALWLLPLGVAAIAILILLAWLSARSTLFTVTSRRIIIRTGVALPVVLNLPYKVVGSAGLKVHADGTGDIPLSITGKNRVSYMVTWPYVRPWRIGNPEPMLRAIPDAAAVGRILADALAAAAAESAAQQPANEQPEAVSAAPASVPAGAGQGGTTAAASETGAAGAVASAGAMSTDTTSTDTDEQPAIAAAVGSARA